MNSSQEESYEAGSDDSWSTEYLRDEDDKLDLKLRGKEVASA